MPINVTAAHKQKQKLFSCIRDGGERGDKDSQFASGDELLSGCG